MKHLVTTTEGQFLICKNTDINKGIKIYSIDGKPLFASAKVNWWDLNGIERVIKENIDKINERKMALNAC